MEHLLAALLGVLAGTLSAMFGVGGGLIFVPTLIFLGSSTHQRRGHVAGGDDPRDPGRLLAPDALRHGALEGGGGDRHRVDPDGAAGRAVANDLSNDVLRKAFAVLLFAVAVQMGVRALRDGGPSDSPSGPDPPSA